MSADPHATAGPAPERGLSADSIRRFAESMPEVYRLRHDPREIAAHAQIVAARVGALVHVGSCPGPAQPDAGVWVCVVADDRPGLLSLLSAAISAHSLDILGARAYCRVPDGLATEAIDLFAVRRLRGDVGATLGPGDLLSLRRSIESLLRGETSVARLQRHASQTWRPGRAPPTVVYFSEWEPDLLHVETADRPGLLLALTLTIFRERLSIIRSHVSTTGAVACDEFQLAEIDGQGLTADRRAAVIEKISEAVARRD
jgi:UTP:GlnB (protein PII) uridylyltransferase